VPSKKILPLPFWRENWSLEKILPMRFKKWLAMPKGKRQQDTGKNERESKKTDGSPVVVEKQDIKFSKSKGRAEMILPFFHRVLTRCMKELFPLSFQGVKKL